MNFLSLAFKNIKGSRYRSAVIFLCVLCVASFSLSVTLLIKGAEGSLKQGMQRLGADIVIFPDGVERTMTSALLMGKPSRVVMSPVMLQRVSGVAGVAAVSPQIYLASVHNSPFCQVADMYLIVYDPATDFTVAPWLKQNLGRVLAKGEVFGGSYIFLPPGLEAIRLFGNDLTLTGNLAPTGTGLDQSIFMTVDTAQALARSSRTTAAAPLEFPTNGFADGYSALMVRIAATANQHDVAKQIAFENPGIIIIESQSLFGAFRAQMTGLLWGFLTVLIIVWVICALLIGLVFSMAANERQREIAVLRALGATRGFIFRSMLAEATVLALAAGVLGIILSSSLVYLFRNAIADALAMPFLFPGPLALLGLALTGLAVTIGTVILAALLPAMRASYREPALAMRD